MSTDVIGGDLLGADISQTIATAVNARIEAAVGQALAGDEVIGRLVTAALMQKVETDRYDRKKDRPYLHVILDKTVKEATKVALAKVIEEERPQIEDEIRKALRRNLKSMAEGIANSAAEKAATGYGIKVELQFGSEY